MAGWEAGVAGRKGTHKGCPYAGRGSRLAGTTEARMRGRGDGEGGRQAPHERAYPFTMSGGGAGEGGEGGWRGGSTGSP